MKSEVGISARVSKLKVQLRSMNQLIKFFLFEQIAAKRGVGFLNSTVTFIKTIFRSDSGMWRLLGLLPGPTTKYYTALSEYIQAFVHASCILIHPLEKDAH